MKHFFLVPLALSLLFVLIACALAAADTFADSAAYTKMDRILQENFADYSPAASFDAENQLYIINLEAGGIAETAYANRDGFAEQWATVRDNFAGLSGTCRETIETCGYPGVSCAILMTDTTDSIPVSMLICYNGSVLYDFMKY